MKKIILIALLLPAGHFAFSQGNSGDTGKVTTLDEVVFSANKFSEKKKNIAQKIDIVSGKFIERVNAQSTGDLLINTGTVFVQKSQQGGSSPVIRGFEASRVLLVIDGVRMNNAIYRAGHLQNVITVDQNMLHSAEILYGPASTVYGSDALGGVIHFRSKAPQVSGDKNFLATGGAFVRYSSVNDEKTGHVHVSLGGKKFAWLQSYTYSGFGDLKMGDSYLDKYPNFGRRSQYVTRINGIDSVVTNEDDRLQRFSGFKQWDIMQKLLFKQSENVTHSLNLQSSNSTNVPRYDRLQDIRNGTLRYAEWFYGPQERLMASYELEAKKLGFLDIGRINVSYQDIQESRQTREYRRYDRFDSQVEQIKVIGFTIDGRKLWGNNELTVGLDGQLNDLKSTASRTNINTGAVSKLNTRYPDGKNNMNYFALYVQHLYKFKDGKFVLNDGIRFQSVNLHSTIVDNSFFNLPYGEIKQDNFAITGNLGLVYLPKANTKVAVSLSSGFRAPNIDDLAKIFESSTSAQQLVVPNPDIEPEYTYNIDVSWTQIVAEKFQFELTGFYTWFRNALIKAPFPINGEDSMLYNGVMSQTLATQNVNRATIYGFNAAVKFQVTQELSFVSTLNLTKGNYETDPAKTTSVYQKQPDGTYLLVQANVSSKPLDHIPPLFGKSSLMYSKSRFETEVYAIYNAWKKLDEYNPDGEDNAQYATADGMPGWVTLNWRGSVKVHKYLQVQLGVENILDRNYRYFASGFSAGGRNFIFALRSTF